MGARRLTRRPPTLASAIEPGDVVVIDTSVVVAYIGGAEPTSNHARELFDGFVATGRNPAVISTVTVAELLVRPFRRGGPAIATAEGFLRHFAGIRMVDVSYDVARTAARIRAATDLPMPDALIAASAAVTDAQVLLTNDRAWTARIPQVLPNVRVLVLSDLA